jgi:hypothetical protein
MVWPGVSRASSSTVDLVLGVLVGQQRGAGGGDHRLVAAGVVAVLVGVQHLGDVPAHGLGLGQALLMVQGIDGHRLTALRASDQVVEVAIVISGPNLLDDHGARSLGCGVGSSLARGPPQCHAAHIAALGLAGQRHSG